jgi:hypothetical protein
MYWRLASLICDISSRSFATRSLTGCCMRTRNVEIRGMPRLFLGGRADLRPAGLGSCSYSCDAGCGNPALGGAVPDAVCMPFCFAQRARWAAAMRRRAEADIVRVVVALEDVPFREVRAWMAWSMRVRSCCSSLMIPSMFDSIDVLRRSNVTLPALRAADQTKCSDGNLTDTVTKRVKQVQNDIARLLQCSCGIYRRGRYCPDVPYVRTKCIQILHPCIRP